MDNDSELLAQLQTMPELFEEISASKLSELSLQKQLRERYPAELVRLACTLSELRRRAAGKFSQADRLWMDRTSLEQSTAETVAIHKAQRFAGIDEPVFDLCSGMGMDTIALALAGCEVVSVDRSPIALSQLQLNAEIYGVADHIEPKQTAAETLDLDGRIVHVDPDRRAGHGRAVRLEDYQPSLEFLQELTRRAKGGAIKLSPASNFGGKFPDCEIELVSLNGECKEATVWFGSLRREGPMRATLLPNGATFAGDPLAARPRIAPLQKFLYDPDPSIVRSGLVDLYASDTGFCRLDDAEEYLTSDQFVESPGTSAFEVLTELPNNPKEIAKWFRSSEFGDVEIKCRHVPIDVDGLRRRISLSGTGRGTLVIARILGKTRAVVCQRVNRSPSI